MTFNRLTVLSRVADTEKGVYTYLCRCQCGVEKQVQASNLRSGSVKSCGCLNPEARKKTFPFKRAYRRYLTKEQAYA
jgi:hypothetical protein